MLLPIPGSPPSSTIEPATIPPPKTRLNSSSDVLILYSLFTLISSINFGEFNVIFRFDFLNSKLYYLLRFNSSIGSPTTALVAFLEFWIINPHSTGKYSFDFRHI